MHYPRATLTRKATALALLIVAAAVTQRAASVTPRADAKGPQAEVQIGLCAPTDRIVRALALRPRGKPIDVWQFDDDALTLFGRGLRLRLRVAADGRSEFTLKVADQDCARLDPGLVPPGEGKCEYDAYGARVAGAVSLTRTLDAKSTGDLLAGRVAPAQALAPAQTRYLRDVIGAWPLPPGVRKLGPIEVRTYRSANKLYDVDVSRLPGGEQFAEISRKVPTADAEQARQAMERDLSSAGVPACADQSSQAQNKLRSLLR